MVRPFMTDCNVAGESLQSDNLIMQLQADGAISKGKIVELVSGGHVKQATATIAGPVGIALSNAVTGDDVPVLIQGIGSVAVNEIGISINDYIKSDSNGNASEATFGLDDIVGVAVSSGSANGAVAMLIRQIKGNGGE